IPVLGLTPFKFQAFSTVADRYLYLSMLGPSLGLAWVLAVHRHRIVQGVTLFGLFWLGWGAAFQTLHWSNTLTLFQHALEVNPRSALAHYNLGNALERGGAIRGAMDHYAAAIRVHPHYASAYFNLGGLLAEQGQTQAAIACYRRNLQIEPDAVDAHVNLGIALFQTGHLHEAEKHFQAALRLDPQRVEAHYNWGFALEEAGQFAAAIAHYRAALRIRPDYPLAQSGLHQAARALARQRSRSAPRQPAPTKRD
ncbi:MAG: tetratricopeptide repeat protein, partial [Armatimonadota bacterium]|nr:tetratricopeptide repeat protein [Armatimonadota bacterium]